MRNIRVCVLISCLLSVIGCGESECPAGTARVGGRCALLPANDAARDTSLDGGMETIELDSGSDAIQDDAGADEQDAGVEADACTAKTFFFDADEDGHGDPETMMVACEAPEGYVESDDDCNDECPTCFEGATELCDNVDQDCDGTIDEDLPLLASYADLDGDSFGDPATEEFSCAIGVGRVRDGEDCDDRSRLTHPNAIEICNGIDDNCNVDIDEGALIRVYRDADGDGFGSASAPSDQCTVPRGFTTQAGDCDDNRARVFPGAPEVCDGHDNDCDEDTDEGIATTYYADCDGDGFANTVESHRSCTRPTTPPSSCVSRGQWVTREPNEGSIDCDDENRTAFPGNIAWSTSSRSGGSFDYDCNGISEPQLNVVSNGRCRVQETGPVRLCRDAGWVGAVPGCGVSGMYQQCNAVSCGIETVVRIQACR
jgi:hypothetical protein